MHLRWMQRACLTLHMSNFLELVNKLQGFGISTSVPIPKLVLCGDVSSGKSSVLEAISKVPLPRGDNTHPRMTIKVLLRQSSQSRASVVIKSAPEISSERQETLNAFRKSGHALVDIASLVEQAAKVMKIDGSRSFSEDVLQIFITGPQLINLDLVDLLGFVNPATNRMTPEEIQKLHSMIEANMHDPGSVLLTVLSAKYATANQIAPSLAKKLDHMGQRTITIMTKLDVLMPLSERQIEGIGMDPSVFDKYGWHVVRNASHLERARTDFDRDSTEAAFFSTWPFEDGIPSSDKGVTSLRKKIAWILFDKVCLELPNLVNELQLMQEQHKKCLLQFGDERSSERQQRAYMYSVASQLESRTSKDLAGMPLPGVFPRAHQPKRLRAVVQGHVKLFAEIMDTQGCAYAVVDDLVAAQKNMPATPLPGKTELSVSFGQQPFEIGRSDFLQEFVIPVMSQSLVTLNSQSPITSRTIGPIFQRL